MSQGQSPREVDDYAMNFARQSTRRGPVRDGRIRPETPVSSSGETQLFSEKFVSWNEVKGMVPVTKPR
jgi:hypothetical protein